jgi:hypothetical protein
MTMKNAFAMIITGGFVLGTAAIAMSGNSGADTSRASKTAQPVVVELFTSEGCSTCPPADALLMQLESTQPVEGVKVIALEEHVDYWNHDGWTDPYSSSDWTLRQQEYVFRFKDKDPFTPQMIFDGQTQFLGDANQAKQMIQQAGTQAKTEVTVAAENSSADGGQQFKVYVGKLTGNSDRDTAEVWLAVSESGLQSSVGAGENAGKTLHHASVLRSLHKIGVATPKGDTAFESSTRIKFKPEWKTKNLQVVAFVQEKKSMRILGAATTGVAY